MLLEHSLRHVQQRGKRTSGGRAGCEGDGPINQRRLPDQHGTTLHFQQSRHLSPPDTEADIASLISKDEGLCNP
ncbi:hypothetical protein [Siccirubricoccus sp. G192]|uniref:hypothetical protein n=1 Tax=Siccirubricoccus sp. G192 TaxID=2849651 RepID=UPI001C2BA7B0|nr:hypothetical protein [Siccirubricoccus sp. G192]MBV1798721.1 hypothetical protein [Siccirubricoccus sp. G192]